MFNWKYLFNILTFDARAAFRFRAAAAFVCVSRVCVGVWVWERAKVSGRYFWGPVVLPRLVSSLSLFLSLFVRFACSTDFILELHLMALNLQMPKGRKREGERAEQNTTMQTIILWRLLSSYLFLSFSLTLLALSPVRVRVRVFLGSTIFEYFPIFLSFILPSIFISMHLYLFVFLLLIFFFWFFSQLFLTFSYWYAKKQKSSLPKTHIHTWYIYIYIYILGYFL